MKVLFIISNSETAFWLSEVTHPYWHLTERGVKVDFASPKGGKVVYDPYSDPYFANTTEPEDLVSKGFLSDPALVARLETTLKLRDVDLNQYDAVHVAGGRGATFDLFPSEDVTQALEHFWAERNYNFSGINIRSETSRSPKEIGSIRPADSQAVKQVRKSASTPAAV